MKNREEIKTELKGQLKRIKFLLDFTELFNTDGVQNKHHKNELRFLTAQYKVNIQLCQLTDFDEVEHLREAVTVGLELLNLKQRYENII